MLQRQEEDGNPRNLSVFTKDIYSGTGDGGFAWARTPEGADFWEKVLVHQNFDLFFEKYPKEVDDVPETKFKKGDRVTFVGEPEFAGSAKGSYHYITIPDRLITHGPTMIDYEYPIIIEDIYEEYYIVSFINNETGNATQLGFKEEALEFYVEEEKTKLQTLQSIRLGSTNQPRYEEVVEAPWEESCKDTIKKDNNFKRLKTKFF